MKKNEKKNSLLCCVSSYLASALRVKAIVFK